jgi:nicotinamide-nucleotide amidase
VKAAVLSIGDELLGGRLVDTNAAYLCKAMADIGIATVARETVLDDRAAIAAAGARLAQVADILIATGGLGPTPDDLTRWAVADLVDGGALIDDGEALGLVRAWCEQHGLPVSEARAMVAKRPPSARFLSNDCGTAPGLAVQIGSAQTWWLPGPPTEMQSMFTRHVIPAITSADAPPPSIEVRAAGLTEVHAADLLADLLDRSRSPRLGIRVGGRLVRVSVECAGERVGREAMESLANTVRGRLGSFALPPNAMTLAEAVGATLLARGWTLASAESCTGGGIGAAITAVAGSSQWYAGGWVTYSNTMKIEHLGVAAALLAKDGPGAVSGETARAMAAAALDRSSADIAVAVTGIAGPDGGSDQKPVGTVWLGMAMQDGVHARRIRVPGDRAMVRGGTIDAALQWVRWLAGGEEGPLLWEWPE